MIEKITPDHILGLDGLPTTIMPDSAKLMRKINELVDAVNELQKQIDRTNCAILDLATPDASNAAINSIKASTDPYAEQRKCLGKLCRFWDDSDEPENCAYDILVNVFDLHHEDCPFQCGNGEWYEYCEPVKLDDDIIYKGGDNE